MTVTDEGYPADTPEDADWHETVRDRGELIAQNIETEENVRRNAQNVSRSSLRGFRPSEAGVAPATGAADTDAGVRIAGETPTSGQPPAATRRYPTADTGRPMRKIRAERRMHTEPK